MEIIVNVQKLVKKMSIFYKYTFPSTNNLFLKFVSNFQAIGCAVFFIEGILV
jgi:hypothetical protein